MEALKLLTEEIEQKAKLKQREEPLEQFYTQRKEYYKRQPAESSPLAFPGGKFYKAIRDRVKGDGYFQSIREETTYVNGLFEKVAKDFTRAKPVRNLREYRGSF